MKQLLVLWCLFALILLLVPATTPAIAGSLYTRTYSVTNGLGSAQTNYPLDFVFNTAAEISAGRMRSDCGDLRMYDTSGFTNTRYAILNCNTTWTSIVFVIPNLPTGTSGPYYMRYGDPTLLSNETPTLVFDLYDLWTSASVCTIAGPGAAWDGTNNWLRLTQNIGNQTGTCNYTYTSPLPNRGYRAWYDTWAGGTVNGADSSWQYAYNSAIPTAEDITLGGVHFTVDEYDDRMCYTRSTTDNGPCTAAFGNTLIDNSTWRTIKVSYDITTKRFFENGTQRINTTAGTVPTTTNTNFGFAARTGGVSNEHRVRRLGLIRFSESVTTTVPSALTSPPPSILSFAVRNAADTALASNVCNFGDIVPTTTYSCQYRLKVTTNATGGYTVFMNTSGSFVNASGDVMTDAAVGTGGAGGTPVNAGTEVYGVSITAGACDGVMTRAAAFSPAVGNAVRANYTAATQVLSCNLTNNPAATDLTNTTLVDHLIAVRGDTEAGLYNQSVTWTVVPTF